MPVSWHRGQERPLQCALSYAIGALPQLTRLDISWNEISNAGVTALADACARGALTNLTHLILDDNPASPTAKQAAQDAIKNRK